MKIICQAEEISTVYDIKFLHIFKSVSYLKNMSYWQIVAHMFITWLVPKYY